LCLYEIYRDYWLLVPVLEIFVCLLCNVFEILDFVLLWENNLLSFWRRDLRISQRALKFPKFWLYVIKSLYLYLAFIKLFEIFKIFDLKNYAYPLNYTLFCTCIKYFLLIEIKWRNYGICCRWSFSNAYSDLWNLLIFLKDRIVLDLRSPRCDILEWLLSRLIQWWSGRPVAK
jgi:hypothetical protein